MATAISPTICPPAVGNDCSRVRCHETCALQVIDNLLSNRAAVSGEEVDRLLDLRFLVHRAEDAEATLRVFSDLRMRMEQRHYLAFFRLRRWLENHLDAAVRICPAAEPRTVELTLNHYCVEAIRRVALCSALGGGVLLAPRLQFRFRVEQAAVAAACV